jgi:eukaryotic-like serine/threonine-protein kinase
VHASELAPDSSTLQGQLVLGRYRVVRPLARGGMGVVYLGRVEGAAGFAKPVVIKSIIGAFGSADESEQLFAREARIVANLQHPNIVAVVDFGKVGSSHVMVLEYVHGYHLGQWFRYVTAARGRMPVRHAVHVVLCVLDALAFAHGVARSDGRSLGIVHRDVSPANVLIDVKGQVKLSDFGIARSADDEFKTQEGLFRGTLPYSAPEALQGGSASPAFDQYAAAVVLYQLLAGINPFKGAEPPETVARVLTHVPAPVSSLCPDVPIGVEAAIRKALAKDPAARFPSVADFARALRDACTWSEREAAEAFAADIRNDFTGPMAETLGQESLAVREASWRDAQDVTTGRRVSLSSSPPRLVNDAVTTSLAGEPSAPKRSNSEAPTARVPAAKMVDLAARAKAAESPAPTVPVASGRRPWIWIVLAAGAAGAGSAGVLLLAPQREAPRASGVVVIEKQNEPLVAPTAPASIAAEVPRLAAASASTDPAESAAAPATKPLGRAPAASGGGAAPLAQAFQKQGGKIQRCFEQNPGSVQGFSVRFQIDTAGKVENATVTPASVASTPLGACVAAVARGTTFGSQPEPVAFSIPIAARVVKR